MSHSTGKIRTEEGQIFHFEYNGTSDVCLPFLYDTEEELDKNWRRRDWKNCNCNNPSNRIVAEIVSTYGGGFYWPGIICKECKVIVDGHSVDYEKENSGFPDWFWNTLTDEVKKFYKGFQERKI